MRRMLLCMAAAVLAGLLAKPNGAGTTRPNIMLAKREVSLGRLPTTVSGPRWLNYYVSADKNHCAWIIRDGDEWKVVVDGREGRAYEGVASPLPLRAQGISVTGGLAPGMVFSPDGRRVAYAAARDGHEFVVVDGIEGPPYDVVAGLVFSPDSRRLAYEASHGTRVMVVVDGAESAPYDAIGGRDVGQPPSILFSPDSRRVAYLAQRGSKWLAVVDGEESGEYDEIHYHTLAFSPDSKHVTYQASRGDEPVAVQEEVEIVGGHGTVFSPDGRRAAYWVRRGDKSVLILDGDESGTYDAGGPVVFSQDGQRTAATVTSGDRRRVVVDGIEGEGYDEVMAVTFSPDGERVAYVAATGGTWTRQRAGVSGDATWHAAAAGDTPQRIRAVVDGVAGKAYSGIGGLQFSPDGSRVVYVAATGGPSAWGAASVAPDGTVRRADVAPRKVRVVVDGIEGPEYDHVIGSVVFSPDSSRMAYTAIRGGTHVVVVDGEEWGEYPMAHGPVFSPDGRHLVWAATRASTPPQAVGVTGGARSRRPGRAARGGRRDTGRARSERRGGGGRSGRQAVPGSPGAVSARITSSVLVVDGIELGGYTGLLSGPPSTAATAGSVVFDAPNRFHTLVERAGEAIRVEVEIWEG